MAATEQVLTPQTMPIWASKAIVEQLHEGVIILAIDGSFRRMNHAAARLYGYDHPSEFEQLLPKLSSVFELRSFPDRKLIVYRDWPMSKLQHGTRTVHMRVQLRRKDTAHSRILEYNGKIIKAPDGSDSFAMLSLDDITQQVRDQEALKQGQERLQLAQKAGKIGTFEWQIVANKNIWSEELERLYGLRPGTFKGTIEALYELLDPEDRPRVKQIISRAFRGRERYLETEWRIITPNGGVRCVFVKAEIMYNTDNKPIRMIGINMDITQRRTAAMAYKTSVDRQSAFFKSALDAIITVDGQGTITEFNPAAERIFGYSRRSIVGKDLARLIAPPTAHRSQGASARSLIANYAMIADKPVEGIAIRHDDQEFPVELFITRIGGDEPAAYMLSLRDITERKRAEEELRASEQRFRFMAEAMPQKIFTARPDGVIDYINPQWNDYLGLSFEDINKTGWSSFLHPDDIDHVRDSWKHAITTSEPYQVEQRIRNQDGEYRWHLTIGRAMHDADGKVIKWIGSNTDIEDVRQRQALEERTAALTEQREQLVMINHAKDEFISLASHQLRTPATGVKQYVGMLMQGYFGELTEEQQAIVRSAYDSNERQLGIINALLNVARLDAGKVKLQPVPCDMSTLLEDIIQELAEVFRMRRQTLTLRTPQEAVECHVDTQLIRMVLENIIDNAGKYSPVDKNVTVRLRQSKLATLIEVIDQGVGMRKRDQAKLFQKFSRIDNELSTQASGSGLGLYWARKIMDLHGGTISVDSRPRQGTTFTITIPRDLESVEPTD